MRTRIGLLLLMGVIRAAEYARGCHPLKLRREPLRPASRRFLWQRGFRAIQGETGSGNWQAKLKVNGISPTSHTSPASQSRSNNRLAL